jgi:hypothetical protein
MIQLTEIMGVSYPFDNPRSFNPHFTKPIFVRPLTTILVRPFSIASTPEIRRYYTHLCYFVGAQAKEKLSTCPGEMVRIIIYNQPPFLFDPQPFLVGP